MQKVVDVEAVVARTLGIEPHQIDDGLSYQDIAEWDSLRHVALMVELESESGLSINEDLIVELRSVAAIKRFFGQDKTQDQPDAPHQLPPSSLSRGLEGVCLDRTTISRIDGEKGILEYRGYSAHDLADYASFEENAYLLLKGELPNHEQLSDFSEQIKAQRVIPEQIIDLLSTLRDAHPTDALRTAVSALGALRSKADRDAEIPGLDGMRLIAQIPLLIAAHHAIRTGRTPSIPVSDASHAECFLRMMLGEAPTASMVDFVTKQLIVHADHGSNASAFAARVAIGARTDTYAAITAAISVFSGSRHGGAAETVLALIDEIGVPEAAESYVRERMNRGEPVMGFGHRVYRTEDPRVRHLRDIAWRLAQQQGNARDLEIIEAVTRAMEPYSRHGVNPNVDLYAGAGYRLRGLPDDLAVNMFIAGRIVGWAAQIAEQRANNVLIRPLLEYIGPQNREYLPIVDRDSKRLEGKDGRFEVEFIHQEDDVMAEALSQ